MNLVTGLRSTYHVRPQGTRCSYIGVMLNVEVGVLQGAFSTSVALNTIGPQHAPITIDKSYLEQSAPKSFHRVYRLPEHIFI